MRHIRGLQNHQRPDDFHKKNRPFFVGIKKTKFEKY
jgi:hypothetical protein